MTERRPAFTPHVVLGLLTIVAGVLFTLDNVNVFDADEILRFWPTGLIAIGLARIWQVRSGAYASPLAGVMLVGAGAWLQLETLGYVEHSLVDLWPLGLVALGVLLVAHGLDARKPRPASTTTDTITAVAVMAGINRGSNATTFRGGELTAFMGGCEIDLRRAAIHGEAVIDVFAMWGGIEIRVPDNWAVIGRVTPLMGAFEDHTRAPLGATEHRLIVRGFVVMGGIEIKN